MDHSALVSPVPLQALNAMVERLYDEAGTPSCSDLVCFFQALAGNILSTICVLYIYILYVYT